MLATMQGSCHSHCASAYTDKEDLMLCQAWFYVGMNPICGAEQNGGSFWKMTVLYFHEPRKFPTQEL
jgi:hypothetical protein